MPHGYLPAGRRELTPRQLQVLALVARGQTNREIARALGVGEETVKRHLRELRHRLRALDRAHAVNEGWRQGYLDGRGPI